MKSNLIFPNKEQLADVLASQVISQLEKGITFKGSASLVVSGGNTPKLFFEKLSNKDIEWGKVTITLADERWVETSSNDSNEHFVKNTLLQNKAKKAKFIGLKTDEADPVKAETACHNNLKSLPLPIDAVVLGMGTDGHTASFFPKTEALTDALDLNYQLSCKAVEPLNAPHKRMTLTLPFLLNSKVIYIHIEGAKKLEVYQEALKNGALNEMPIRSVLRQQKTDIELFFTP